MSPLSGRHIAFAVNVDWFFASHRLAVARALLDRGVEVTVMAALTETAADLEAAGIRVVGIPFSRSGRSPTELARATAAIRRNLGLLDVDLIHNVTAKPMIAGSLAAASLDRSLPVVNAVSGFGHLLSDRDAGRLTPNMARLAYSVALRAPRRTAVIVQNEEARDSLSRWRMARPRDVVLIPGMGVDTHEFRPVQRPVNEPPVVMFASRLIASKGVLEFAQAADLLRQRGITARFVLIGPIDPGNPGHFTVSQVERLALQHQLEWRGASTNMAATLREAEIFVLPTYHEGLPRALLEAAATALPIVATDIPGCRLAVRSGKEALLVPPREVRPLALAIETLLTDSELSSRLGRAARQRVEEGFTVERAVHMHIGLYEKLMQT